MKYEVEVIWGEKRVEPEELVRLIMPKYPWWQFANRAHRREIEALAATYGMKVYEK